MDIHCTSITEERITPNVFKQSLAGKHSSWSRGKCNKQIKFLCCEGCNLPVDFDSSFRNTDAQSIETYFFYCINSILACYSISCSMVSIMRRESESRLSVAYCNSFHWSIYLLFVWITNRCTPA